MIVIRVILHNYKRVKTELLQLELRKTFCQFIQSYADYAKEVKKDDSEALSKFENIIFSVIVADNSSLPTTYDGLEQLTKLFSQIKKIA